MLGSPVAQSRLAYHVAVPTSWVIGRPACSDLAMLGYCRQAGDRRSEAVALFNLGVAYLRFGAHPQARQHLEESLRLNRALGNRVTEGGSLAGLSELALREGDAATALSHAQEALDILLAAGSRLYQIDALHNSGNAQLALGRWAAAQGVRAGRAQLSLEIDVSNRWRTLEGQSRVALVRGDVVMAWAAVQRLLEHVGAGDDVPRATALDGAEEHRVRLTLHQVWSRARDPRAGAALVEAHRALMQQANAVTDAELQRSFLTLIPENREIVTRWGSSA
jgi:tetratricopeptide (TPR) repeat protein